METDKRIRERMVFDTTTVIKRAIRARAGMDDVSPADVINAALEGYLGAEIAQVVHRLENGKQTSGSRKGKVIEVQ